MKLGSKSRALLDLILTSGLDALDFARYPSVRLLDVGGWSETRYLKRHIKTLHEEGWIVWDDSKDTGEWVLRVTNLGKQTIQEGIDPEVRWGRSRDGEWKLIAFDLPASKPSLRRDLLKWLKSRRFERLQHSLWISPYFDETWNKELADSKFDPSGVSFLSGSSFAQSSDQGFVKKSWNFKEINRRYKKLISIKVQAFNSSMTHSERGYTKRVPSGGMHMKWIRSFLMSYSQRDI